MSEERPLSESARVALARLEHELRKGFTGEIRLQCNDGGVRDVEQVIRWGANGCREERRRRAS